jgi:hypothetical protein
MLQEEIARFSCKIKASNRLWYPAKWLSRATLSSPPIRLLASITCAPERSFYTDIPGEPTFVLLAKFLSLL